MTRRHVPHPSHATVVAYLALFVALGGTAVATTGGTFVLGQENRADRASVLINKSGTPLELRAQAGRAPLRVNTERRVRHLNADLLDRLDSRAFLRATAKAADSDRLDGLDSSAFLPVGGKAADADTLDGKDSTQLLGALCPDGSSVVYKPALAAGCSHVTAVRGQMRSSEPWAGGAPGVLLICPQGQAVGAGYRLADETVRLQEISPWGLGPVNRGWYFRLFPGASTSAIEASTAWVMCLGPGTEHGRTYPSE